MDLNNNIFEDKKSYATLRICLSNNIRQIKIKGDLYEKIYTKPEIDDISDIIPQRIDITFAAGLSKKEIQKVFEEIKIVVKETDPNANLNLLPDSYFYTGRV